MIKAEYFHNQTGQRIEVEVDSPERLMETNIKMGQNGFTPVLSPPNGGFRFGYEAEERFNWASVGGFKMLSSDGEEVVIWRGETYKKRVLEAVDSKKMQMPAAVKYSRGAKTTDPEHMREKADGDFEYVTLAIFRGRSRVDPGSQLSDADLAQQNQRLERQRQKK